MADFTAPASNASSVREGTFPVKAAIVLALAALADWLFYGHGIGISAAIFAVAVACGSLLANLATLNRKQVLPARRSPAGRPCPRHRGIQRRVSDLHGAGSRHRPAADDQSRSASSRRASRRVMRSLSGRPVPIFPRCHRCVQSAGIEDRVCRVVHSDRSRRHLRVSAGIGQSFAREVDQPAEPGQHRFLRESRTRTVLDCGAVDRMALYPRPVERQAGDAGRLGRSGGTGAGNTIGPNTTSSVLRRSCVR